MSYLCTGHSDNRNGTNILCSSCLITIFVIIVVVVVLVKMIILYFLFFFPLHIYLFFFTLPCLCLAGSYNNNSNYCFIVHSCPVLFLSRLVMNGLVFYRVFNFLYCEVSVASSRIHSNSNYSTCDVEGPCIFRPFNLQFVAQN